MWKLSKHLKLSRANSELERLLLERTAALQNLSHRLLILQDDERRKIARELHDNTGQTLAALRMAISCLQESCKANSAALAMASDVAQLADQALDEIRTMSYLLHPPLLDEVGFPCAAEWYIEGFSKRSGINVKADIANSPQRMPKRVEIALFRVLQESLTNVVRHAQAKRVAINMMPKLRFSRYEILDEALLESGCYCSVERVQKRASAWRECANACAN